MASVAGCHKADKDAAGAEAPVIDVAQVETDSVTLSNEYPGYLDAKMTVDLVARVDGYLTGQNYSSGDFVRKGTVLFTIESDSYADAVRKARAALSDAEASYAYAEKNYAAMQKALQSDAVSQMEVLQSKSNMEAARASISSARAALQQAQTTLGYCTVRAPFSGHVSGPKFDVGAYLAGAGAPVTLATIYDDSVLDAVFSINDKQYAAIKANAADPELKTDLSRIPVEFETAMPHKYYANLYYMAPVIEKGTGTMQLKAAIDNAAGDLKPGMFCKIHLPYAVDPATMLVKDASIGSDQSGNYVYVVNDSNRVESRAVKVGQVVNDTLRVITEGLKPGEKYVTRALLKVRDGMTVKPHLVK